MKSLAAIYNYNLFAGILEESDGGVYVFTYDEKYLLRKNARSISLTLPLRKEPYVQKKLFPFFDGLIPEGWLLNIATRNWKIDPRNRMQILRNVCLDCIGSVHVVALENKNRSGGD